MKFNRMAVTQTKKAKTKFEQEEDRKAKRRKMYPKPLGHPRRK
jgi:hypothetical protein